MKKRVLSLLLTLTLALGLAVPATAAGYQPLTLYGLGNSSVTFSAATLEKATLQVAQYAADNSLGPYTSTTVNLVRLRPGSTITVKNGIEGGEYYGIAGSIGWSRGSNRYAIGYTGAVMSTIYQGTAENTFRDGADLRILFTPDQETYYIIMGQAVGSSGFADVADSDYFAKPVQWAVSKGITNGTGAMTFSPKSSCTTAQILTFLYRANGSPTVSAGNPFADVTSSDYYFAPARWAGEKGLVGGRTFNGDAGCTRANVVTYLWKLAGSPAASGGRFTDVAAGSDLAKAVAWALSKGITNGTTSTTFSPNQICTRGEIVTFLYRAYGK